MNQGPEEYQGIPYVTHEQCVREQRSFVRYLFARVLIAVAMLLAIGFVCGRASAQTCDIDFNNDNVFPDNQDVVDFDRAWRGDAQPGWDSIDFNRDGVFPDARDMTDFYAVFSGAPCPDPEWRPIVIGPSTVIVYVHPNGDDANPGTIARPVRTLDRGYRLLPTRVSSVLALYEASTFPGPLGPGAGNFSKGGGGDGSRMYVTTYAEDGTIGAGKPATIVAPSDGRHVLFLSDNPRWITFRNLRFDGVGGRAPARIFGVAQGIRFEGVQFLRLSTGFVAEGFGGPVVDLSFFRCVFADSSSASSHSQGIYADDVDGLSVLQCVFASNGILGGRTIYNHGAYITARCRRTTFRDCIAWDNSATNLQLRSHESSAYDCLSVDGPLGITLGHEAAEYPAQAARGTIDGCVVIGGGDIGSFGRGMGIAWGRTIGARITRNILANGAGSDQYGLFTDTQGHPGPSVSATIEGNVVWAWGRFTGRRSPLEAGEVFRNNEYRTSPCPITIEAYLASIGEPGAKADFIIRARANNPAQWDRRYTAAAVCAWARDVVWGATPN